MLDTLHTIERRNSPEVNEATEEFLGRGYMYWLREGGDLLDYCYPLIDEDGLVACLIDGTVGMTDEQEEEFGIQYDEELQIYRFA